MATPDGRSVALAVLDQVRTRETLATAALRREQFRRDLDPRVSAMANRLALGVLRHRRYLDHVLAGLVTRALPRKDKRLLDLLRLAVYELLFMDSIPDYATVSGYVTLARRTKGEKVARFANAVLRQGTRQDRAALLAARATLPTPVRLSLPDWLAREAEAALGAGWEADLERLQEPAPVVVRVNTPRTSTAELAATLAAEGLHPQPLDWTPHALTLPPDEPPYQTLPFLHGLFWPQDAASQLVVEWTHALSTIVGRPGRILDACAGNGTKRFGLQTLGAPGPSVAADVSRERLAHLQERARQYELAPTPCLVADLSVPPLAPGTFDTVLLDSPCSGLGTLRRHPELKWRRTRADIAAAAQRQRELLDSAAPLVTTGGLLAYAVCSFSLAEGPDVVDAFLAGHPDFTLVDLSNEDLLSAPLRALANTCAHPARTAPGHYLTRPSRLDSDLFYMAFLKRL